MKMIMMICLLLAAGAAEAASVREVTVGEGEMTPIYVSPRFSTLIKFDAHPEPGLIGDQDAFKVEYMRNMVAVKPLVSKGKTNLFIFTKEGQFNFQLIADRERHDNIVQIRRHYLPVPPPKGSLRITPIDDLLTRKIGKSARSGSLTMRVESISAPVSRSTLLVKFEIESKAKAKFDRNRISIRQGGKIATLENLFIERTNASGESKELLKGFLLIRYDSLKKKMPLELCIAHEKKDSAYEVVVPFQADL